MDIVAIVILTILCAILMFLERLGMPTALKLHFKGDIKRESRWLAQYGQAVCPVTAAILVYQLEPDVHRRAVGATAIVVATFGSAMIGLLVKRILGRVRPGHEGAGKFLGPTWKHANWRESFPSNHTASAIAMSAVLARLYPPAAATFWLLAFLCALLRYVLDAHFPSDVIAGSILGLCGSALTMHLLHLL